MTIHIHTKHYKESGLEFLEYMMCLLYEGGQDYTVRELVEFFTLSERTVIRIRMTLVQKEYLIQNHKGQFVATDKLYPKHFKKMTTNV